MSADIVRKQLKDLSPKVHTTIQPVFVSRKIEQELNVKETKPPIVNQQCVVYGFQCDLNMHGTMPQGLVKRFEVLKKCRNKFDCLVFEI